MYENSENLPIIRLSGSTNCWVVRCDGGEYYEHFKKNSLIAIGHIDFLKYEDISEFMNDIETAESEIIQMLVSRSIPRKVAKKKARSDINHAIRFIEALTDGDYVVTIGHSTILIGIIEADSYIDKEPLLIKKAREVNTKSENVYETFKMDLSLRRSVSWIAEIPKIKVPFALQKLLISPLTIFKMKNPTILYHTLYPSFIYNNNFLHFSILIEQKSNIKNRDMLELLTLLDSIEQLSQHDINTVINSDESFTSDLNIKASFMSPGEIFANFPLLTSTSISTFYVIYSFLFGNKFLGIDGLIPKEGRIEIIKHYLEARKESVKKLELSAPDYKIDKK